MKGKIEKNIFITNKRKKVKFTIIMKFASLEKEKKKTLKEQNQNEIAEYKQKDQFDIDTEIRQKILQKLKN